MEINQYEKHYSVDYDHDRHRYSYRDRRYTSATQLLEQFIPPFDVEERSVYMAHRYGHSPLYWKQKWRSGNRESLDRGDFIHDREECSLYQQKFIDYNPLLLPVLKPAEKYHNPLINLPDGVYPEMKLWRHDHEIAGRSDKVILYTMPIMGIWEQLNKKAGEIPDPNKKRIANVEDYKTNKKIAKFGYQDPVTMKTRKLLGPLSHIEDATYWHYTLQLSIYQYMLEYHGFEPGYRRLIHFPHPTDEFPNPKPVPYDLPYLRDEVIAMIKFNNHE